MEKLENNLLKFYNTKIGLVVIGILLIACIISMLVFQTMSSITILVFYILATVLCFFGIIVEALRPIPTSSENTKLTKK